jgi:hypothetical protein
LEWKQSEKLGKQSLEATAVASQEKANDATVEMSDKLNARSESDNFLHLVSYHLLMSKPNSSGAR